MCVNIKLRINIKSCFHFHVTCFEMKVSLSAVFFQLQTKKVFHSHEWATSQTLSGCVHFAIKKKKQHEQFSFTAHMKEGRKTTYASSSHSSFHKSSHNSLVLAAFRFTSILFTYLYPFYHLILCIAFKPFFCAVRHP